MTSRLDEGMVVLVPRGHLHEGDESDALELEISRALECGGKRLLVDLSQTRHLSARSVGILANAHRQASARGGRLSLGGLRPEHRLALEVTGLLGVLEVQDAAPLDTRASGLIEPVHRGAAKVA